MYQKFISPVLVVLFGRNAGCRFYPTCSEYTHQAIEQFGAMKGLWLGVARVLRCNPLFDGGVDELQVKIKS